MSCTHQKCANPVNAWPYSLLQSQDYRQLWMNRAFLMKEITWWTLEQAEYSSLRKWRAKLYYLSLTTKFLPSSVVNYVKNKLLCSPLCLSEIWALEPSNFCISSSSAFFFLSSGQCAIFEIFKQRNHKPLVTPQYQLVFTFSALQIMILLSAHRASACTRAHPPSGGTKL